MKHIFTIHSSITFLVAYSVVEHLHLDRNDVVLISSNYEVPISGFQVVPAYQDLHTSWFQKIRFLNVPKNYDKFIDKITGGETFTAYVDLMSYYQKIVVTHKNCEQFHFIEEGNSAYMVNDDLADLTWEDYTKGMDFRNKSYRDKHFLISLIRVLRGYNLRLVSLPYHYMAFTNFQGIKFFSFSKNAFFNAPSAKKVIVKPDPTRSAISETARFPALHNEVIWIDGSNARYTGLAEEYYHKAIQKAIDKFKVSGVISKKVFVKLRPGTKEPSNNKLVSLLEANEIEVKVLPDKMILESLFICSKNCRVIGTLTSALEYAHVFGHKAYSIYGLFEKQPPTFFDKMSGFWQNVEKI